MRGAWVLFPVTTVRLLELMVRKMIGPLALDHSRLTSSESRSSDRRRFFSGWTQDCWTRNSNLAPEKAVQTCYWSDASDNWISTGLLHSIHWKVKLLSWSPFTVIVILCIPSVCLFRYFPVVPTARIDVHHRRPHHHLAHRPNGRVPQVLLCRLLCHLNRLITRSKTMVTSRHGSRRMES